MAQGMSTIDINLLEWNATYEELAEWCKDTGATVYAVNNTSFTYRFTEVDFVAFKLMFGPRNNTPVSYKGESIMDSSFFYCPYIPIIK